MIKKLLTFLLVFPLIGFSTSIMPKPLSELVSDADHILVGKVVHVDMIDSSKSLITDTNAITGPGLYNTIRLHVIIQDDGVIYSNEKNTPTSLIIPLWNKWHYNLGQIKKTEEEVAIFLLKGSDYKYVYPGLFRRPLSEKKEIQKLIKKKLHYKKK